MVRTRQDTLTALSEACLPQLGDESPPRVLLNIRELTAIIRYHHQMVVFKKLGWCKNILMNPTYVPSECSK